MSALDPPPRRLPPLDPSALAFRPLALADLGRLHAWVAAPHVSRWFGERSLESITLEYSDYIEARVPLHAFIVCLADRPIGMVDWSRFGDFPELMEGYDVDDPDAANCDIVIGEPDIIHRGLGAPLLVRFLREHVFANARVTRCIIDPHAENTAAIRAYAKAGFRHLRSLNDHEDGRPLALMELRRLELPA
jgi:aminoglycoside 6'-N-acetyltransferase